MQSTDREDWRVIINCEFRFIEFAGFYFLKLWNSQQKDITLLALAGSDVVINTDGGKLSCEQPQLVQRMLLRWKVYCGITLKDSIDGSGGLQVTSLPTLDALNAPVVIEPASLLFRRLTK